MLGGYNELLPALFEPASYDLSNAQAAKVLIFSPDPLAKLTGSDLSIGDICQQVTTLTAQSKAPVIAVVIHGLSVASSSLESALAAVENLTLITAEQIQRRLTEPVEQLRGLADADVPFARDYWAAVSALVTHRLHQRCVPPKKVLVLDCDNTLWRGVVGEDGVEALMFDASHQALIRQAALLRRQGWLICLCSKNDEADVQQVFEQRNLALRWQELAAVRINWEDKPNNLRALAAELGVGLDSLVFIDDNPVECALVKAALPQVATIQFDQDADHGWLERIWPFETTTTTAEDQLRAAFYADRQQREALQTSSKSPAEFLAALNIEMTVGPAESDQLERIAQLSQRTNQFNFSGKRLDLTEVTQRFDDPNSVVLQATMRDRFGDYGLIGIALGSVNADTLLIDGFCISCRALGRGVEHAMVRAIAKLSVSMAASSVSWLVRHLPRNEPALRFAEFLAGQPVADGQSIPLEASALCQLTFDPNNESIAAVPNTNEKKSGADLPERAIAAPDYLRIAGLFDSAEIIAAMDAELKPRPSLTQSFVAPRPGIQQQLAGIWRAVLKLDQIGVDDQFNDLGGQSIQLVSMHQRITEQLRCELALVDLFRFTTIRLLAEFLTERRGMRDLKQTAVRSEHQRAAIARFKEFRRGTNK